MKTDLEFDAATKNYMIFLIISLYLRDEDVRGSAQVRRLGAKVREARLRWFGHMQKKEERYIGRRILGMGRPGTRKGGRPKRRFMDVGREEMKVVGVTEEEAGDREI